MKSAVAGSSLASTAERPASLPPSFGAGRAFFIFDAFPWVSVLRNFRADLIRMGIAPALLSPAEMERKR